MRIDPNQLEFDFVKPKPDLNGRIYRREYTTFSGIDITLFNQVPIQSISLDCVVTRDGVTHFTLEREMVRPPQFTSCLPRSISRGKRGIAGSMVAELYRS